MDDSFQDSAGSPPGSFAVAGGGSAGFLSALTLKAGFPDAAVTLIRSPRHPVIGVGESTTRAIPVFLHETLGIDREAFYRAVRPIWKLGNRLEWGDPAISHFNYPFDQALTTAHPGLRKAPLYYCADDVSDISLSSSLMDQNRSPCSLDQGHLTIRPEIAYHIDNRRFLGFLEEIAVQRGIEIREREITGIPRNGRDTIEALVFDDGSRLEADLYIDCTGFASRLLGETLGEPVDSYADTLFCDSAIVGSRPRGTPEDDPIHCYTTSTTMTHGWCWRIDFLDRITRGYVFASAFCTPDEAREELISNDPRLQDDLRLITFPSERRRRFWGGNVAAIGNASGFVEPLEATALQMISEQLRFLTKALLDAGADPPEMMRELENRRFRRRWDDIRDFLAVHYRFNRRIDSPFWRHCRGEAGLGNAEEFVEYYQKCGPSTLSQLLAPEPGIFELDGYLTMLLGQRVPTERPAVLDSRDLADWKTHCAGIRNRAAGMLSASQALTAFPFYHGDGP